MQKLIRTLFIIFLLLYIPIHSEQLTYRVRMDSFSGTSVIDDYVLGDTLYVSIKTNIAFGLIRIENLGKINIKEKKSIEIASKYNRAGVKSDGTIRFLENSIETFLTGEKKKVYDKLKYEPNDWLLLPFFFKYYEKDVYNCSMIHGDFELNKTVFNDTIFWKDEKNSIIIKLADKRFVYLKAGKILMEIYGEK
ncbi:MAG: hypothetical protein ABIN39_02920 [candidate division WOR-3 bacterium]